jgi:hypothetical protein
MLKLKNSEVLFINGCRKFGFMSVIEKLTLMDLPLWAELAPIQN